MDYYPYAIYDLLTTEEPEPHVYCSVTALVLLTILTLPFTINLYEPKTPLSTPTRTAWIVFFSTAMAVAWRHAEWTKMLFVWAVFTVGGDCGAMDVASDYRWCVAEFSGRVLLVTMVGLLLMSVWMSTMILLGFQTLFLVVGTPEEFCYIRDEKKNKNKKPDAVVGKGVKIVAEQGAKEEQKTVLIAAVEQDMTKEGLDEEEQEVMLATEVDDSETEETLDEESSESGSESEPEPEPQSQEQSGGGIAEEVNLTHAQMVALDRAARIKRFDNYIDNARLTDAERKKESWRLLDSLLQELRSREEMELEKWENQMWDGESVAEGDDEEEEDAVVVVDDEE